MEEEFLLVDPRTGEPAPRNADGLSGHTLDLIHGRGAVPAREQLDALVQRVRPALDALGEYDRAATELDRVAARGNGAMRQRRAWQQRHDVMDVVAEVTVKPR